MSIKPIPFAKNPPIIGALREFAKSPPDYLNELARRQDDIIGFRFLNLKFVQINDPELVRQVLVTKAKKFRKGDRDIQIMSKMLGNGLVTNNDHASHKKQRKLAQPAFHMRRIAGYADVMVQYSAETVDGWQDGEIRDISAEMFELTMYIVSKTLFDADKNEMSEAASKINDAIHTMQAVADYEFNLPFSIPEWIPTWNNRVSKPAQKTINETLENIIARRRAESADGNVADHGDLLSMLLMAQDEDGASMDDIQVRDEAVTLFVAGHETTSNALTWTWYLISQNPDVEAKLHAELDAVLQGRTPTMHDLRNLPYTEKVIKESMRLYPPAWVLNARQANEDVQIGDYLIPKDQLIFIAPYSLHRNPTYFENPEEFNPDRWTAEFEDTLPRYAYIPFGGGPRVCIGNSFAMMEAQLIVATIAQRYQLSLMHDQKIELQPQITLSSKHGLRMRLTERTPEFSGELSAEPTFAD